MDSDGIDRQTAAAALASAQEAGNRLADVQAKACPPWRHAAFGLLMGAMVLAPGLPTVLTGAIVAMCMAGVVLLVRYDRARSGTFVNGYRRGATRPLVFALLGTMLVLIFAETYAKESGLSIFTRLGIAVIAGLLAGGGSVVFQRLYLRELRGGMDR
ncbi:hypothetical protein [Novosphingobium sp. 9]|uniref:hypothetical protein n=1 Tax=Novosphingobium sp. 9 TaxID=2025349 RepID=UPI0021B4E294|nr:hypothetical protein [Novosphingobium sp. 9]